MERKLVTVWRFSLPIQAETAQHVLATQGIQSFLGNVNVVAMDWLLGNAVGGVQLDVAEEDAAAAMKVLEANPGLIGRRSTPVDQESDSFNCLACGQLISETQNQCPSCGWTPDEK
jgi:hypothetical protein